MKSYDLYPSAEIRDAVTLNLESILYALFFDISLVGLYTHWQVFLLDFFISLLPMVLNCVWYFLSDDFKKKMVQREWMVTLFYVFQGLIFCFLVGTTTFFFASTITYDWVEEGYIFGNAWLGTSVFLTLTCAVAALHSYSFTMLVYRWR